MLIDSIFCWYSKPSRVYHTLPHIVHCFLEFDSVKHFLKNPEAVELAIWFHDIVYETSLELYPFNEERSVGFLLEFFRNKYERQAKINLHRSLYQLMNGK